MAGIYLHIPFCKQKCHYCDFFSTTRLSKTEDLVQALCVELNQKKEFLGNETVSTIYFGGGTPSVLNREQLQKIFSAIKSNYQVDNDPEITLEANPDDLTPEYFNTLAQTLVNRLSIGIQSFIEADLKLMNRRHSSQQAIDAVKLAQAAGFNNLSIDLIYGLPDSDSEKWKWNLQQAQKLGIQHISAYHLTFEPKTVFTNKLKKNQLAIPTEEESIRQFEILLAWAAENGFEHYEISNFAQPNRYSRHNTAYWKQQKYVGVGPSAHSYNLTERRWNVSNLDEYIKGTLEGTLCSEHEILTETNRINEFIMTNLRTIWGINLGEFEQRFGVEAMQKLLKKTTFFNCSALLEVKGGTIGLTKKGLFVSDGIISDLMFEE